MLINYLGKFKKCYIFTEKYLFINGVLNFPAKFYEFILKKVRNFIKSDNYLSN